MKTVIFGDIHGRKIWEDIIAFEKPDQVIFLGDFFTSREGISEVRQIENYEKVLKFKETSGLEVIILRGNHDMEALGYGWASCFPYFSRKEYFADEDTRQTFLDNTQWLYVDGDTVYCHAGITEPWFEKVQKCHPEVQTVDDINKLNPSELFGFSGDDRFDCYGTGKTQPLTWVRPETLLEFGAKGTFVVGHTVQNDEPKYVKPEKYWEYDKSAGPKMTGAWLCDCLGQGGYLVREDDKFIPKNYYNKQKDEVN